MRRVRQLPRTVIAASLRGLPGGRTRGLTIEAADLIDPDAELGELRDAARACTACDLHRTGTQTVFGEGPPDAQLLFVGEQPGDVEDERGRPFVGPAGRELDRALDEVGLADVPQYRTNAVKHFKWQERRGKRRIHEKPNRIEIRACLPWLRAELARTRPKVLVPLGATAVQSVLGWDTRITTVRGRFHLGPGRVLTVPTVHPSSVLRARSDQDRSDARAAFTRDLEPVAHVVLEGLAAGLGSATVPQLRALATQLDITGAGRARKRELVAIIADHYEAGRTVD